VLSVLHAHTILVASIFTLYMAGMGGLIAYACWLGKPRDRTRDEDEDRERDHAEIRLAA
jgi:hypothetical protein